MISHEAYRRWATPAAFALAAMLALVAAVLLYLGTREPSTLKAALDRASPSGNAALYTLDRCVQIVSRARVAAAALFLGSILTIGLPISRRVIAMVLAGASVYARSIPASVQRFARSERSTFMILVAITLAALVARVSFVSMEIRGDEADTWINYVSKPLAQVVSEYSNPNNHPLNSVLMWFSTRLLGADVWALRLPVLIGGVLLVPATGFAARAMFGRVALLPAAAMAAFSPYMVYYSVNARGYTFVMLATAFAVVLLARAYRRPRSVITWGAWALTIALGFWAIPTMLFSFAVVCTWIALDAARSGARIRVLLPPAAAAGIATVGCTVALYLPMLVVSGPEALTGNRFVRAVSGDMFLMLARERASEFLVYNTAGIPAPFVWLLTVCLACGVWSSRKRRSPGLRLLLAILIGSGLVLLYSRTFPYARVWTFLLPFACAYIGMGAAAVLRVCGVRAAHACAAAILSGVLAGCLMFGRAPASIAEGSLFEGGAEVADALRETLGQNDRVLMTWPALPSLNYHQKHATGSLFPVVEGTAPFTIAVIDAPLEEFNRKLSYTGYPAIAPDGFEVVREFRNAIIVRLTPPLPGVVSPPQ